MSRDVYVLGISAYYHDSAATLLKNGKVLAAVEEERFTRIKHDGSFPSKAIDYCLNEANIRISDVDYITFFEKPNTRFKRRIASTFAYAPRGLDLYLRSIPNWVKKKLYVKDMIYEELNKTYPYMAALPEVLYAHHHQSHAASAFFPSPYQSAAVLCIDGVGEWTTTSAWRGEENKLHSLWDLKFPHSLGMLYSAFTYYTGFKINSGEYKLMGLAPYGEPIYRKLILDNLVDLKEDGTFKLNMDYFSYGFSFDFINNRFRDLFGLPPRKPEGVIDQKYIDIARSIQDVSEEIIVRLARTMYKEVHQENLCLAGGVALNCVANGKVLKSVPFKNIWIQPAAGDAGGSLGAALATWHEHLNHPRNYKKNSDNMKGSFLGPQFSNEEVIKRLLQFSAVYEEYDENELVEKTAQLIAQEKVIGWFQGRMEFGPRALGHRSIIGDPRSVKMQSVMNLKIKFRESFRPFAPIIKQERASEFFDIESKSPYMLLVAQVKEDFLVKDTEKEPKVGLDKLKVIRSIFPAITHVDNSARIQTVDPETNPIFHKLLNAFESDTGCPILINTSFNVRGEPIVCTPEEAYTCFMRTNMDCLVIGNFLFYKENQPKWVESGNVGEFLD